MKNKKKLGLTTLIFIALIAGAITGIIINYCIPSNKIVDDFIVSGLFYVVGQGFIRLMRMLVVPLVFCSIVCGSMAVGDTKKLGAVGLKTMLFYLCTTALAVVVALCIANVINPGIGLDISVLNEFSWVVDVFEENNDIIGVFPFYFHATYIRMALTWGVPFLFISLLYLLVCFFSIQYLPLKLFVLIVILFSTSLSILTLTNVSFVLFLSLFIMLDIKRKNLKMIDYC